MTSSGPASRRRSRQLPVATALIVLGVLLPMAGRPAALLTPLVLAAAVTLIVTRAGLRASAALVATLIGVLPAVTVTGASHDLLGVAPPVPLTTLVLAGVWVLAAGTLGAGAATTLVDRGVLVDVWARIIGALAVTGFIAAALGRLLLPGRTAADRLVWAIWEEDNAQIVGIAREVLTDGPRGAALADQFGTAFVTLPLLLTGMLGGPIDGETDPRLQAITVFTVSTIVVIALAGLAMALIAGLPQHVHARAGDRGPGALVTMLGAGATAVAALVGFSLLVVLPMRTGFLTFVWGLTLVLVGAALVVVTPSDATRPSRLILLLHLVGVLVLLLSSWSFIAPALAPLLLVPLVWVRWADVRASIRRHQGRWSAGLLAALALLAVVGFWFSRWGPAAEVLSYGLDILVVDASGISADRPSRLAATFAILAAGLLATFATRPGARMQLGVGILGPVLGGGALYLLLRGAAALFTDGELNYSGIKLLYGVVTIAAVLGLLSVVSASTRWRIPGTAVALVAVLVTHQVSTTASLHTEWWDRTDLGAHAHVDATIDAIERTSPDLPIRCLPSPGTVATPTARWAAYMCARWMEDAFNEGRFGGHRSELLRNDEPTFERTVERILAESQSEYLFAHRFTMGPGWFGWTGPGS